MPDKELDEGKRRLLIAATGVAGGVATVATAARVAQAARSAARVADPSKSRKPPPEGQHRQVERRLVRGSGC